jgi:hypothetical protein
MIEWLSAKARLKRQKAHLGMGEGSKELVHLEVPVRLLQQVGRPVVLTATNFSTRFFLKQEMLTLIRCQTDATGHVLTTLVFICIVLDYILQSVKIPTGTKW